MGHKIRKAALVLVFALAASLFTFAAGEPRRDRDDRRDDHRVERRDGRDSSWYARNRGSYSNGYYGNGYNGNGYYGNDGRYYAYGDGDHDRDDGYRNRHDRDDRNRNGWRDSDGRWHY